MMHMMRYHIYLFGYHCDSKVLRYSAPKAVFKFIRFMRTVTVVPDGAMGAHDNHAIHKRSNKERDREKFKNKQEKKRGKQGYFHPAKKW